MRKFHTGATRDSADHKLHYGGYLSPKALLAFAKYMKKNETQADGKKREAGNWKRGMPTDAYMDSMWRHFIEAWTLYEKGERGVLTDLLIAGRHH